MVLANGHIYEITEDDRSFHSFRTIKRINPSIELGLTDEVMCYISKGADPALLLEFISDFDALFVGAQKEKIHQTIKSSTEEGVSEKIYKTLLSKAEGLLNKYGDQEYLQKVTKRIEHDEGLEDYEQAVNHNEEIIESEATNSKSKTKKKHQPSKIKKVS